MHCVEVGLKTLYLHIMYNMIFLVAFLGSFIVICVYSFKRRLLKRSTIIRLNLPHWPTLPDALLCYREHSIFGEFMCKFICFGFHFKLYSSILFLPCFSAFLYTVMAHTMKFFHIQRKWWTAGVGTTIWLMSLKAVRPINFLISYKGTQNTKSSCINLTSSETLGTIRCGC